MDVKIEPSWKAQLQDAFATESFARLTQFVKQAYQTQKIYPKGRAIFRAFDLCPFHHTRVVILGQDPYHGAGQADGLCFSVQPDVAMPPSLKNIFKEIQDDIGAPWPANGHLERWAKQGVLMLNATLTVRAGAPGTHQGKGWEEFTDAVVRTLSEEKENLVFLLWGAYAQKKGAHIASKHLVLQSAHPSPFAAHRGFFGCRHFSKTNAYLQAQGLPPIVW